MQIFWIIIENKWIKKKEWDDRKYGKIILWKQKVLIYRKISLLQMYISNVSGNKTLMHLLLNDYLSRKHLKR